MASEEKAKRRKSHTLPLKLEAEYGGSNTSQVVSNRSWGSDTIVLIEAWGFY